MIASLWLSLLLQLGGFTSHAQAAQPDWVSYARQVGQAEVHRPKALSRLKKIKGLDKILFKNLNSNYRSYALDVISAMKKEALLPGLLQHAPKDRDGFLILTINSLVTNENLKQVTSHYLKSLEQHKLSAAAIVAMLEPLGRLGIDLPQERLKTLMNHDYPEVRSAALYYIRTLTMKHKNSEFLSLLEKSFSDLDVHTRHQAYTFASEIIKDENLKSKLPLSGLETKCNSELISEVKNQCLNIFGKGDVVAPLGPGLPNSKDFTLYMIFGYKDSRPARFVGDRHERLAFVQKLLSPCRKTNNACGFKRDPKDSNVFTKRAKTSKKKSKTLRLLVVSSAAGTDDQANREDPFQNKLSDYAQIAFSDGLKKADGVFYNGHSRFGGGPDFKPPVLNSEGKVNAGIYTQFTPGLTTLADEVRRRSRTSKRPLKVLGLFSCASTQHFKNEIKKLNKTQWITSTKVIHYSEALKSSLKHLSEVLKAI